VSGILIFNVTVLGHGVGVTPTLLILFLKTKTV